MLLLYACLLHGPMILTPSNRTLSLGHALLRNCRNICVQTGNHPRHGKSSSFRLRLSSVRTRPTPIPTSLSTATPRVVSGTDRVPGHSRAQDLGHPLFLIESLRSALSTVLMCKDVVSLERQIKPINRFDRQADVQGGTSRALQFATTLCTSFNVAGFVTYSSTPAAKAAARSLSLTKPVKAAM